MPQGSLPNEASKTTSSVIMAAMPSGSWLLKTPMNRSTNASPSNSIGPSRCDSCWGAPSGARVMSQHSAGLDREEWRILGHTQIRVDPSTAILGQMRDASCGRLAARAQHRGDLTPAVEPAQSDLPADHEAEEQDQRGVLGGQAALRLHAPAELLVEALDDIRGPERLPLALGELEEGGQLVPALLETADHAGAAGPPLPLERGVGAARGGRVLGVHDPVEVGPDLGEGMFRRLALKVAQFVDTAALDQRRRPDEPDGLPQAGVSVDHAPQGSCQPARNQIVETPLPGLKGLAAGAELEGQELLLAVGEDRDDAEDRDAHDLPGAPDPQREGIEIQPQHVEPGQRPGAPGLELGLQGPDDPGHGALRERRRLEQRRQGPAEPPAVAPGQVGRDHRLVDFPQPTLVPREQRRGPFSLARPGEQPCARDRQGQRAGRPGQCAWLRAVAVAAPAVATLVDPHAERGGQLLVHGDLDRAPHRRVDQLAQRARSPVRRPSSSPGMLAHGAFLRWPPWRAAGSWLNNPPEECAISLFHTNRATTASSSAGGSRRAVISPISLRAVASTSRLVRWWHAARASRAHLEASSERPVDR